MYKVSDSLLEQKIKNERSDRLFLLIIALILAIMTTIMALNQFVFVNVSVSGPSMQPTLYTGDSLVVNRKRVAKVGDIVVIQGAKEYWLIKRVIACEEGDIVEVDGSVVKVNGVQLEEDYITPDVENKRGDVFVTFTLKEDEIFYLGDNRGNSSDSRDYGPCKDSQIVGVVEEWSLKFKDVFEWFNSLIMKIKQKFRKLNIDGVYYG